jgi:hypothetical protein
MLQNDETTTEQPTPQPAAQGPKPAHEDAKLAELMRKDGPYWRREDPAHAATVLAATNRFKELNPDVESAALENGAADLDDLRRAVGVNVNVPQPFEDQWSKQDERVFLGWCVDQQVSKSTAQLLIDHVIDAEIVYGAGANLAKARQDFFDRFAGQLSERQLTNLYEWYVSNRKDG